MPRTIDTPRRDIPPVTLDQALAAGPNTLLDPGDVSRILRCHRMSLVRQRQRKVGPRFIKMSRSRVAYRAQDVADYLQSITVQTV